MPPKQSETAAEIEAPAKLTEDHIQDRHLDKAGSRMGWTRLSVLEKAHRGGKLVDRERCKTKAGEEEEKRRAAARYIAGGWFTECWLISVASWPSGSDLNRVRVAGVPGGFVDHQVDVKATLRALEEALGTNDWMILRRVCGENCPIAETVTAITPAYKASTLARFREALDALIEKRDQCSTKNK